MKVENIFRFFVWNYFFVVLLQNQIIHKTRTLLTLKN